ncbi:STAS domain-containing protein [Planococcus kocurii]|uniref:Anti-anti-sigma factor n=1 Tax=Planococcus kocurii TaxID=1374 RepID=A0ABM5WYS7_9BACL|nr:MULTISPECIES: STAS domain-containing protein [Planococcus]ALS79483.1 anti-anti-sigma factor [Planococcus kocurii]KAA0957003.1 STAS domain-containing protein [Planococcus sp. ANT_H30]
MSKKNIVVGGIELQWDLETGETLFEGGDVVFFWISAMETFFDTIKDISGIEATQLVLETTGFRQGVIVGEGFKNLKQIDTSNIVEWISNTYAPAGWGRVEIIKMDTEHNTFTLHIQNDWEYKMNLLKNKGTEGIFVPSHYAGVLTGLFGINFWYKTIQYQNDSTPYSIVEYFPSEVTVQQNIRELSRKQEADQIQKLEALVDEHTKSLQNLVRELSSPIIPVLEGIIVVPMIGSYDEQRTEDLIVKTLSELPKHKAQYLLVDLTGLNQHITEHTASLIDKLGASARLLGTEVILVGISPELAIIIAQSQNSLKTFESLQSLQHGIYYALGRSGRKIV